MNPEAQQAAFDTAVVVMLERIVLDIARSKGQDGARWIDEFRNAAVTEINDADADGQPANEPFRRHAISIVQAVAQMAKDRHGAN